MTVFGGFEMPVSYAGIIEEHLAVRSAAGFSTSSHMGEFELSRSARARRCSSARSPTRPRGCSIGQAQYTLMCAPDGGTIDDLIVYRLDDERYMLCVNASNIAADREWLLELNAQGARAFATSATRPRWSRCRDRGPTRSCGVARGFSAR